MVDSKSLKTLDLFASMEQRELDRLAQRAADIALKPSEWLVREDERMHFSWFSRARFSSSSRSTDAKDI